MPGSRYRRQDDGDARYSTDDVRDHSQPHGPWRRRVCQDRERWTGHHHGAVRPGDSAVGSGCGNTRRLLHRCPAREPDEPPGCPGRGRLTRDRRQRVSALPKRKAPVDADTSEHGRRSAGSLRSIRSSRGSDGAAHPDAYSHRALTGFGGRCRGMTATDRLASRRQRAGASMTLASAPPSSLPSPAWRRCRVVRRDGCHRLLLVKLCQICRQEAAQCLGGIDCGVRGALRPGDTRCRGLADLLGAVGEPGIPGRGRGEAVAAAMG